MRTMTWSSNSRRAVATKRSATAFCQGRQLVRVGSMLHGPEGCDGLGGEDGLAVEEEVLGRRLERESLAELLDLPSGGRVRRNAPAGEVAPVMANDEEHVQTRNVTAGTVKKSIPAMPSRWFRRKVIQLWPASEGGRGSAGNARRCARRSPPQPFSIGIWRTRLHRLLLRRPRQAWRARNGGASGRSPARRTGCESPFRRPPLPG